MAEHPLLIFPRPETQARTPGRSLRSQILKPPPGQQAARIEPHWTRLHQAMDLQSLRLRGNALGIQPELALVLETYGSVEKFLQIVREIEGLEWLGEATISEIDPSHGFEDKSDPQKTLGGHMFLVMTDIRALQELSSYFQRWKKNPDDAFPKGLAPLKSAFEYLKDIRPWGSQDRIRDTGLIDEWNDRLGWPEELIPFDVELWYRGDKRIRANAQSHLMQIVEGLGGEIIGQCTVPEICYDGVRGRIPRAHVKTIIDRQIEETDSALVRCEGVHFVRPAGQCYFELPNADSPLQNIDEIGSDDGFEGPSVVALLDGMPLIGHNTLGQLIVVDDPDGFESDYQAHERCHATQMASLICRGDLAEESDSIPRPIYVRPILKPNRRYDGEFVEEIPENELAVDLVHRAVRRIFEPEDEFPPAASATRIINYSICERMRPFDREMSPIARLIDWLAWKYNVLFVVSAGNQNIPIDLDISAEEFLKLDGANRERAIVRGITLNTRRRRLLSPAESVNSLTVGASHSDNFGQLRSELIDPFEYPGRPSIVSSHGPGYRRAIKPELFMPGGRQLLEDPLNDGTGNARLPLRFVGDLPGQKAAIPGPQGDLNYSMFSRGTSNAAAIATRGGALLFEVIERLRTNSGGQPPPEFDAVLIKALLVHGSEWDGSEQVYKSVLEDRIPPRGLREAIGRFLGYGNADIERTMYCTDHRVTVVGFGNLADKKVDEFTFPLPPSMSGIPERRKLTVTLAWLTPIRPRNHAYRGAKLSFGAIGNDQFAPKRLNAHNYATQRGTVQHEVFTGERAVPFQDGESIKIRVDCRSDAMELNDPVKYGLAVTIEAAQEVLFPIEIYEEIRERLAVQIRP